jgi:hypothetical protein
MGDPGRTAMPMTEPQEELLQLPWNLTEWVSNETLWDWILEEIDSLDWSNSELVSFLRLNPGYRPKPMLCLITYGYATGVWETSEIVRLYDTQVRARKIDPDGPPSATALGRFRRENRALFKWALAHLLKRVVRHRFGLGDSLFPPGLKQYVLQASLARIDIARHVERAAQGA